MMNATQPVLSEKLNIPDSYKGMDDILIPNSPFKNIISFEKYRFRPIVFLIPEKRKYEYKNHIYVVPAIKISLDNFTKVKDYWRSYISNKYDETIKIKTEKSGVINGMPTKYLEYTAPGYDDDRYYRSTYIERIYFVKQDNNTIGMIRSVRLLEDDSSNNIFLKQWGAFVKTIRFTEPNPYSSSVKGKEQSTRRYFANNLSVDIPTGLVKGLNKWRNKRRAVRGDDWQTPEGEISFRFQITSGYDFKPENENENIKMKADALATGGSDFFESLDSNFSREYESIEHPFGKDHKIYGYKETGRVLTEVKLETAYKTGKTIQILIKTRNEIFDKYEKTIIEWLKYFVVLQET